MSSPTRWAWLQPMASPLPLTLPINEAAKMVGCKNSKQFLREVEDGIWPEPLPIKSRPRRWSVEALKRKADELAGLASMEPNPKEWKDRLKAVSI